jgi:hypothetical protein
MAATGGLFIHSPDLPTERIPIVAKEDAEDVIDYVECTKCSHPVEVHGLYGCTANGKTCFCKARWTLAERRAIRRVNGLPMGSVKWGT